MSCGGIAFISVNEHNPPVSFRIDQFILKIVPHEQNIIIEASLDAIELNF
jgi:hypothetical protein